MADQRALVEVTGGVDTHKDTHVVAAKDGMGRVLGTQSFPATAAGYAALLGWLRGWGTVVAIGVEGTGSYGAGLARYLTGHDVRVVEVNRPDRAKRRQKGKSDPQDAINAAAAVQSGDASAVPKAGIGVVEAIRVLRTARLSAVKSRTVALNQLESLIVTAPTALRETLAGLTATTLLSRCALLRPGTDLTDPTHATKTALRRLARRVQSLTEEITHADTELHTLTTTPRPPHPRPVRCRPRHRRPTPHHRRRQPPPTHLRHRLRPPPSPTSAAPHPSTPAAAAPPDTASTAAATATPTPPSTASSSSASATAPKPRPTSPNAPPKDYPNATPSAASNATSPARSTTPSTPTSPTSPTPLDIYRSIFRGVQRPQRAVRDTTPAAKVPFAPPSTCAGTRTRLRRPPGVVVPVPKGVGDMVRVAKGPFKAASPGP